jgi:hypothetical protein
VKGFLPAMVAYGLALPLLPSDIEPRITRLRPAAFRQLPENLVLELQRRNCTIPQPALTEKPANVIKGHFARPDQTDWAVLCSVKGVSSIVVFWNGSETNPALIEAVPDRKFLQGIGHGKVAFSRAIGPAGRDSIIVHHIGSDPEPRGPKLPPIDHEGIEDAFIEKGSEIHYFYRGKWLKLPGAD